MNRSSRPGWYRDPRGPRKRRPALEALESRSLLAVGSPGLTLSLAAGSVVENAGPAATTATVTRVNTDNSQALTVLLASSDTTAATAPASVVIPAGASAATFAIGAVDDAVFDGAQTTTISATASIPGGFGQDITFGTTGRVSQASTTQDLAIQADGKVVVVGRYFTGETTGRNPYDIIVTRYNADGTLDASFAGSGSRIVDVSGESDKPYAVAIQSDGKIVVGGTWGYGPYFDFELARFNPDGTLDASFGAGGKVVSDLSADSYSEVWDLALQPDGKILAAGNVGGKLAVVRYTAAGALDATFGAGGLASAAVGQYSYGRAFGAALQSDGKIVLAGTADGGNSVSKVVLARFTAAGTLDTTFGAGGQVLTDVPGTFDDARDVALQSDGKLVVVGDTRGASTGNNDLVLLRYTATGALDPTFDGDGIAVADFGGNDGANGVAIAQDGTIYAVGAGGAGGVHLIARYHPDGSPLDQAFGPLAGSATATNVRLGADGRAFVAVQSTVSSTAGYVEAYTSATVLTASAVLTVTDNETTHPPVAAGDAYRVDQGQPLTIAAPGVLVNDTDVDGDALTAILIAGPSHGTLTLSADGSFVYTPNPGFAGADSFTYKVNDGTVDSGVATVSLTVASPSGSIRGVLWNDFNGDGARASGDVGLAGRTVFLDLNGNGALDSGEATAVTAADGSYRFDNLAQGVYTVVQALPAGWRQTSPATAARTVIVGNPRPTIFTFEDQATLTDKEIPAYRAAGFTFDTSVSGPSYPYEFRVYGSSNTARYAGSAALTSESAPVTITLAKDDGGPFTLKAMDLSTIWNSIYFPKLTFTGAKADGTTVQQAFTLSNTLGFQTFAFTGFDNVVKVAWRSASTSDYHQFDNVVVAVDGFSSIGVDFGSIRIANAAPSAAADSYGVAGNTTLRVGASGVLGNDADPDGDPISALLVAGPSHGTLALQPDGSFVYTPDTNYGGPDSFTYKANDGRLDSNVVTVNLTVSAPTGTIRGVLWSDLNGDGARASGDVGLAGRTVFLDANGNGALDSGEATAVTTADGSYRFDNLAQGVYTVVQALPAGWRQTSPAAAVRTVTVGGTPQAVFDFNEYASAADQTIPAYHKSGFTIDTDVNQSTKFRVYGSSNTGSYAGSPALKVQWWPATISLKRDDSAPFSLTSIRLSETWSSIYIPTVTFKGTKVDGSTVSQSFTLDNILGFQTFAFSGFDRVVSVTWFTHDSNDSHQFDDVTVAMPGPLDVVGVDFGSVRIANAAPVAANDAYKTPAGTTLTVAAPGVLANDSDPDGDPITATRVAGPAHGTLTFNPDGSFTYTPVAGYNGPDSFTYKANDPRLSSAVATVAIDVGVFNHAPAAVADSYAAVKNTTLTVAAPGVLANDGDADGDPITLQLWSLPAHGALRLNLDGSFTYTPNTDYLGSDQFSYRLSDGKLSSSVVVVSLTVTGPNDPPTAADDAYSTIGNDTTPATLRVGTLGVLANDRDPNGQPLTAVLVAGPSHGTLTLSANGWFTYTPVAGYYGNDAFTYRASDGDLQSGVATATINVNHAPASVADSYTTAEDTPLTVSAPGVLVNDGDADGDPITATLLSSPSNGSLTFKADGSFTYTPKANFNGTDSFRYAAWDGKASDPIGATVTITVTPVNDAPVAADDAYTVAEDGALTTTLAATSLVLNSQPGDYIGGGVNRSFGPNSGAYGLSGSRNYVTVSFSNATEWWYLNFQAPAGTNLAPGVYLGAQRFAGAGVPGLDITGNSRGSNTLTGQFTIYRVDFDAAGKPIRFAADFEQHSGGAPAALTGRVLINSSADLPPGLVTNDTDVDKDPLTTALVTGPSHGSLALNGDGTFSYSPAAGFSGIDTFTYKTRDQTLDSSPATVTINVTPVNDAPAAAADSYAVTQGTPLTVAAPGVLSNDVDADGDSLTAALVAAPQHGALSLNANGTFTYTPAVAYVGLDSFSYKANDGKADGNVVTVTFTVSPMASAAFVATDTTTQGNWKGFYGADGFSIAQDPSGNNPSLPSYATVAVAGATPYAWNGSTVDPRAPLQASAGSTNRVASTWYSGSSFSIDVNLTDGLSHRVALYALDWDRAQRTETVEVIDVATGTVLDSRTLASFQNGVYLVWNLSGNVRIKVTRTGVGNAVATALFFGNAVVPAATASFVATDTTTQGNWKGSYGTDGFSIAQDPSGNNPSLPSYATVAVAGATPYAWAGSTADPRAPLQAAAGSTNRVASAWYSSTSFSIDVNLTDGLSHRVALYALDWDRAQRTETVEVIDVATGAVLDTRGLANFQEGAYLVWNLKGHVRLRVTNTGPSNAVATALFFGDAVVPATASFVATDTTTQGNWKGSYGTDGFVLAQDPSGNNPSLPSYATVAVAGATPYAWNGSTADPRAPLQAAAGSTNRVASTWYSSTSFNLDVNLTDGLSHRVALYALDWDGAHRTETVEVIDVATGAVLDSRTLGDFQNGVYLVWNLKGNVRLRVTNTGPSNAVATALFFG